MIRDEKMTEQKEPKTDENAKSGDEDAVKTGGSQDGIDPEQILAELKEYKDKYIRLYAEFENTRKRMEREKLEFIKYANEELIFDFLRILDDLERCVQAAQTNKDDHAALIKGIDLVMLHIREMLRKNGVRPIEALGKPFDPHLHEILMQEESSEHEDSIILQELQRGYMYNDKVIRAAKVKIAMKTEKINENESNDKEV